MHNRKLKGDDPADDISGKSGITAACDNFMILATHDNGMALYVRGRDADREDYLVREMDHGFGWEVVGTLDDHQPSDTRQAVYGTVKLAGAALTPSEVQAALKDGGNDFTYDVVKQQLFQLKRQGKLYSPKRGQYAVRG